MSEQKARADRRAGLAAGLLIVLLLGMMFVAHVFPDWQRASRCDDAIKSTLKAPATFDRVSPSTMEIMRGRWPMAGWNMMLKMLSAFPFEARASAVKLTATRCPGSRTLIRNEVRIDAG